MIKGCFVFTLRAKRFALCIVGALLFVLSFRVEAQQAERTARIGYLDDGTKAGTDELLDAFRKQMNQLGWVEGKNLTIEYRFGEEKGLNRLAELATDLERHGVDLIVVRATSAALAAKKVTSTIPLVMSSVGDPVGQGIIASLARPGGNITGLASLAAELGGKRLEFLKEAIPRSKRVGVLMGAARGRGGLLQVKEMRAAALALGLSLKEFGIGTERGSLENAFQTAVREVDAIITTSGPAILAQRKRIVLLSHKHALPAMYPQKEFIEEGGLMSYGVDYRDLYRRSAIYVDKILKGAKPAELPVEQPTKFELVINLKTAKQIGVTIPQSVLYRADKVIR